jgi:hypothetical protein
MNIIFGDSVSTLPDGFTILELDTFRVQDQPPVTAYCIVSAIPLQEFALAAAHKTIHTDLMQAYKNQHWSYCEQAIAELFGKWNGELDTFYTTLLERIKEHQLVELPADWDGIMIKESQSM